MALQLGIGAEVRARRSADRGPGTNLGNWLKLALLKGGEFAEEADVARRTAEWVGEYNAAPQAEMAG